MNHHVEIYGDSAHSECYYQFVARNHPSKTSEGNESSGETVTLTGGRYIDRLDRRDGAWKIALVTTFIVATLWRWA